MVEFTFTFTFPFPRNTQRGWQQTTTAFVDGASIMQKTKSNP